MSPKKAKELKVKVQLPLEVHRRLTAKQLAKLEEIFRSTLVFSLDVPEGVQIKVEKC